MCFSWRKGAFDSLTSLRLSEMQAKGAWMVGFHAWSGTELRSWCVSIVVQLPETSRHFFWHCCCQCCNLFYRTAIRYTLSLENAFRKCNSAGQYAALQAAVHRGVVCTGQGAGREPAGKTHRSEVEKMNNCVRDDMDPLRSFHLTWNNYQN